MKNLIIIGAGGHGRETAFVAQNAGYHIVGFLDDDKSKHGKIISSFKCLGSIDESMKFSNSFFTIAIGNPKLRKVIYNRLSQLEGMRFAIIIDPSVVMLGKNIKIEEGSVIFPNAFISDHVTIGAHSIINVSSSISHDTSIGNFVTVNPGSTICGTCSIADGVEVGAGSTLIQGMSVGKNTLIGAGAVVTKSLDPNGLYVGVPAKFKKILEV